MFLSKKNARGEPVKSEFGPWMLKALRVLAKMRRLRGTSLDIFGRSDERRMERRLIDDYRDAIESILPTLNRSNLAQAVEIADLPDGVRGFGHVKKRSVDEMEEKKAQLLASWVEAKAA